jgi:hypothetical protein
MVNVNCVDNNIVDGIVETLHCNVSTTNATTNPPQINEPISIKNQQIAKIPPKNQGSISNVIRSSKYARKIHTDFAWQPHFHDHFIHNCLKQQRMK